MTEAALPPGLVLWPGSTGRRCVAVFSDVHCTDCTVGDQTTDDTDWKNVFDELGSLLDATLDKDGEAVLLLNGDVIDLIRSGRWPEAGVYPWQRTHEQFESIVLRIMEEICSIHADSPGFFLYLRDMVQKLRNAGHRVAIVPLLGNHDKELQIIEQARNMYYRRCLGIDAFDDDYRNWVAAQMGSDPAGDCPPLPFYFADPALQLFLTHGQWRDAANSRSSTLWKITDGWRPDLWQREQYCAFTAPCFGDTIATGLLSHFIWNASHAVDEGLRRNDFALGRSDRGVEHIQRVLGEMDLYRPSTSAVVRLLQEARRLDRSDAGGRQLYLTVIGQFHDSLNSWLTHEETAAAASGGFKVFVLPLLKLLAWLRWPRLTAGLMWAMARFSSHAASMNANVLRKLPAFLAEYRALGLQLYAEGHTHNTLEIDLRPDDAHPNGCYINLGAWRNRIVQKIDRGYRRHGTGRLLLVSNGGTDGYSYTLRDVTSWSDRLDHPGPTMRSEA